MSLHKIYPVQPFDDFQREHLNALYRIISSLHRPVAARLHELDQRHGVTILDTLDQDEDTRLENEENVHWEESLGELSSYLNNCDRESLKQLILLINSRERLKRFLTKLKQYHKRELDKVLKTLTKHVSPRPFRLPRQAVLATFLVNLFTRRRFVFKCRPKKLSRQSMSYGKMYRHLVAQVNGQPEQLNRVRSGLTDKQTHELSKLLIVEEDEDVGVDNNQDGGGDDVKEGGGDGAKQTEQDKLLRLATLLRLGQWKGDLRKQPETSEDTSKPELSPGAQPAAAEEEAVHVWPDFPFGAMYKTLARQVKGELGKKVKQLGKTFETEVADYEREQHDLARLIALMQLIVDSQWTSNWMKEQQRKIENERKKLEEESRKKATKKPATSPTGKKKAAPKSDAPKPTTPKPDPESPKEKKVIFVLPDVELSPVTKLLDTLVNFIKTDEKKTLGSLDIQPEPGDALHAILHGPNDPTTTQSDASQTPHEIPDVAPVNAPPAPDDHTPHDNAPHEASPVNAPPVIGPAPSVDAPERETHDLALLRVLLDALAAGKWKSRVLIKFFQKRRADRAMKARLEHKPPSDMKDEDTTDVEDDVSITKRHRRRSRREKYPVTYVK
ncbi:hypothetical protein M8J77_006834 [Diaphorina citri]|nr:hypothetical protein M8J77_006834 [Diaphorina citri]